MFTFQDIMDSIEDEKDRAAEQLSQVSEEGAISSVDYDQMTDAFANHILSQIFR